jgi:signal transduction histidine kinase
MRDEGSVGRLLSRAFGVLVALIVGTGLIELTVVLVQHRTVHELTEEVQPLQLANDHVGDLIADAQWAIQVYSLSGDQRTLELYDLARTDYAGAVRELRTLGVGRDKDEIQSQIAQTDGWWAVAEQQRAATPRSAEALKYLDRGETLFKQFQKANKGYQISLANRSKTMHRHSEVLWWTTLGAISMITFGTAVIAISTAVRTRRRIVAPLADVVEVLEGRQAGDRSARARVHGPAELRAVAEALNATADQADLVRRHELQVAARLQALDHAKTDFMSTVSHELRTPLTSISGYLELLRDPETGVLTEAQERMLEVIARNARRLRELIEDILTLSRIETGEFRSETGMVDLAEVIERAIGIIGPAAVKASVGLLCDVRGPLPTRGDGAQLDRVLNNLLSNAVKFTPADGTVTIRAERQGGQVTLAIADTGMGIPDGEQQALFARFFRATNAIRQAIPGTGLGLAIVHTIVDNHEGTIEVESSEGVGTTVTVRLPAEEKSPAEAEVPAGGA